MSSKLQSVRSGPYSDGSATIEMSLQDCYTMTAMGRLHPKHHDCDDTLCAIGGTASLYRWEQSRTLCRPKDNAAKDLPRPRSFEDKL